MRQKTPAEENYGIDRDEAVVQQFRSFPSNFKFIAGDACDFLASHAFCGDELVYADPPYPVDTRRSPQIYKYEYSESDHVRLLGALKKLPCLVMLSSYPNELYERTLQGWNKLEFQGTSHVGRRTECVWLNFKPALLHDTRYIGWDFRGRQSWKRKRQRWVQKFAGLSVAEQQCLLDELTNNFKKSTLLP